MPKFEIMLVHLMEWQATVTITAKDDLTAMEQAIAMGEKDEHAYKNLKWVCTEDKYEVDDVSYPDKTLKESGES